MLMKLKEFLERRARQSETQAAMIQKYLDEPKKFIGTRKFSNVDVRKEKADAMECKTLLNCLKALAKAGPTDKEVKVAISKRINSVVIPDDFDISAIEPNN